MKGELGVPLARLVQDVTSVVVVNNTTKVIDTTVPAGKRWKLMGVKLMNPDDVNRNISVLIYLEAAKTNIIRQLLFVSALAATTGRAQWPNSVDGDDGSNDWWSDIILDAGNTIQVTWFAGGASTGATDADGLVIEYLEIDYP